jgi:hypothetical protein
MANQLALARSFYSWVTKIILHEGESENIIPKVLATQNPRLLQNAQELKEKLLPIHHQRCQYWIDLFEGFKT